MVQGRITVVVAVYNTEKYLDRCLNSIINQTYKDLQILLIDDGSTDNSGAICDAYADRDSRITVVHKENEGLSVARNTALKLAEGEFVSFLDSDDSIHPEAYSVCIGLLAEHGADFLRYGHCIEEEGLSSAVSSVECLSPKEITDKILKDEFGSQLWQYLIETELWDGIISPPGRLAQDMMVLHEVSSRASKALLIDAPLYYYYQQRVDNVSNGNKKHVRGIVDRAYAFWLRYAFCQSEQYQNVESAVLTKAVAYTVSAFCNKELYSMDRYKADRTLFRKNIKLFKRAIGKNRDISRSRKICAWMIRWMPRIIPLVAPKRTK